MEYKLRKRIVTTIVPLILIDGNYYNLETIIDDVSDITNEEVYFRDHELAQLYLSKGVLSSLGGRHYACTPGENYDEFAKEMYRLYDHFCKNKEEIPDLEVTPDEDLEETSDEE